MTGDRERARPIILRYGRETVAVQGLGAEFRYWFDPLVEACIAYVDTGSAWVAAGGPTCADGDRAAVAERFVAAARAVRRRACFFCVDRPTELGSSFAATFLGEQAEIDPVHWPQTLANHRRLREQLRRSRAKGVQVRRVDVAELAEGTSLRAEVDALAADWIARRGLEPMGFLVAVSPYELAEDRRFYVAERAGRAVALTWLVPIPARRGWLLEHTLRGATAPNGTTELLLDAAIRGVVAGCFVSLGLAPLSGPVSWPLRAVRASTRALYDFQSLRAFKDRLHPDRWEPAWLVHPRHRAVSAIVEALRAFAGGSLLSFGARSLVRHPGSLTWLVALLLVPWTILLATLVGIGDASLLGISAGTLFAWMVWHALLAWSMLRTARRPRRGRLRLLAGAAAINASLCSLHLRHVGFGIGWLAPLLRLSATIAPIITMVALAWAATRVPRRGTQ